MSEPVRVGVVAEGPTDFILIREIVSRILGTNVVMRLLQPEGSIAFGPVGGGWTGVFGWCKQAASRGSGQLGSDSLLWSNLDVLVVHVDCDVADVSYRAGNVERDLRHGALPCAVPCPPAATTADALTGVILSWCGELVRPPRLVFCLPSKATEAWVMHALFPDDPVASSAGFECFPDPAARLGQQPKAVRIAKRQSDYRDNADAFGSRWPAVVDRFQQAARFDRDLRAALAIAAQPKAPPPLP